VKLSQLFYETPKESVSDNFLSQVWWCMSVIPRLRRLRQEDLSLRLAGATCEMIDREIQE
jgi:hypothetical protein